MSIKSHTCTSAIEPSILVTLFTEGVDTPKRSFKVFAISSEIQKKTT